MGHGGAERCYPAHAEDSQVHLVHMFQSGLSIPVPGKQTGCCHWSCSVADSGSDLKGVFGTCVWMHARSPDIYFYYLFPSFVFLPIVSFAMQHFFHSFSHTRAH